MRQMRAVIAGLLALVHVGHGSTAAAAEELGHAHHWMQAHHHVHGQHPQHQHRPWERLSVADSPKEAAQARRAEEAVFKQGAELRQRKAAFLHSLAECAQGDVSCEREKVQAQIREERTLAYEGSGHHQHHKPVVQDALGRSMPMLFTGPRPVPHESSSPRAATGMFIAVVMPIILQFIL